MQAREWFAQMERDEADALALREHVAWERAQGTDKPVRWICPYCYHELPDEHTPHCGEAGHARAMTDEEANES